MANVGVIGAGSWGMALALTLHGNGHAVSVWTFLEEEKEQILRDKELKDKLPGVKIPEEIKITTDMGEAIQGMDLLVLAVPSPFIRSTAKNMSAFVEEGQIVVSVAKGLEDNTLLRLSEIVEQEIPQCCPAVLCGPSHAEEVAIGLPTVLVAGCKKKAAAELIQEIFMNDFLRVYTSPDMVGMELGGALKNVIALAAGMTDGLGYGDNTKAALITRGIAEISRLAVRMGGCPETLSGLTGIGDLIVTCESKHSRNRMAGMLIGQGKTREEAVAEVKMVVEGINCATAALHMAQKFEVEMPITEMVNRVLFENKPAQEAVNELMLRDRRVENSNLTWEA